MKKKYSTPITTMVFLASEDLCQMMLTGSDGHINAQGEHERDETIDYGGESDGEDFAKHYDIWSTWDE